MLTNLIGSIHWMAPEVINGNIYSFNVDIWSLGCTIIEMATSKLPWGDFDNNHTKVCNTLLIFPILVKVCGGGG